MPRQRQRVAASAMQTIPSETLPPAHDGLAPRWPAAPVRYPDPAIAVLDPRFAPYKLGNAAIECLATGFRWAEGPVWFGDGRYLLFSDIPNNRLMRWSEETGQVTVFRAPSHNTNGHTRDLQGRLISCEHGTRRVTRTEYDGTVTGLADRFRGKPLNAPNDVVVHPDGGIWFTDPGYGSLLHYEGNKGEHELPGNVYRLDPHTGRLAVVTDDLDKPNGLCFSPDYTKLYIADTGATHNPAHPHHIRVFDVMDRVKLAHNTLFADMGPGLADGLRMDSDGNLWAAAGWGGEGYDGVHVFAPDGTLIGQIHLPEACANVCFGGLKRNRLFMAASQSLYAVYVEVQGTPFPPMT